MTKPKTVLSSAHLVNTSRHTTLRCKYIWFWLLRRNEERETNKIDVLCQTYTSTAILEKDLYRVIELPVTSFSSPSAGLTATSVLVEKTGYLPVHRYQVPSHDLVYDFFTPFPDKQEETLAAKYRGPCVTSEYGFLSNAIRANHKLKHLTWAPLYKIFAANQSFITLLESRTVQNMLLPENVQIIARELAISRYMLGITSWLRENVGSSALTNYPPNIFKLV